MQVRKVLSFTFLTLMLAACGGGSGGGPENDVQSSAAQQKSSSSEVSSTSSNTLASSSQTGGPQESSSHSSSHSSGSNGASSDPDNDSDGKPSNRASSSAAANSNYPLPSNSSSKATSSDSSSNNGASSTSSYGAPHSSASSQPSSSSDSRSSASSESSSHSSSSIEADGKAPRATILFPSERSTTDEREITIRGVAYDESGIESVQINGQPATLFDNTSSATTQTASASGPFLVATNNQTTTKSTGTEDHWQPWEITLPLTNGTNTFHVEVTDKSGETAPSADQAFVNWQQVPTTFDFNPNTQTLYGFAANAMVDFDLNSKQQRVYLERQFSPVSGCLHTASSSYYYLVHANENLYALHRLKIDNGADAEETFEGYFSKTRDYLRFRTQLVCDSNGDSLYFLVNRRLPSEDAIRSVIYHRSLEKNSSWSTLYETDEASVVVSDVVSGKDALIGYSSSDEKIVSISKSDGSMETLFDNYTAFTMHIAHGSTKELVYLTTFDGIDRVNIAEQSISTIGEVESDNPLHFSEPRSTYLDPINQRFLIGDSDYHSIISIDQHTGERTIALSNEMGTGPKLVAIRDVVLNEGETYAYVIDDGGNAAEKVFEIDLATGNRQRIGDINSQYNISVAGLELDAPNEALYVATNDTVYRIDLSTNATTTLAISDINQGAVFSSISAIAFDHESKTLFISDAVQEQIVALNVNTLETTLVSSEFKGKGQAFADINGLVFDPDTTFLYASNQGHGNVHRVDTETGNRTEIATACAPSFSSGEPADMIMELSFDSELDELLLVGDRVSRINLNTSTCNYDTYGRQLSVEPLSGDRLLAGTFGALTLIDEETGEVVAISQ